MSLDGFYEARVRVDEVRLLGLFPWQERRVPVDGLAVRIAPDFRSTWRVVVITPAGAFPSARVDRGRAEAAAPGIRSATGGG